VTDRGAQTLNDYARDADPFTKIGVQAITVEVNYIVRASSDSFEIRWREQTYQDGTIVKTESFTGVVAVIFGASWLAVHTWFIFKEDPAELANAIKAKPAKTTKTPHRMAFIASSSSMRIRLADLSDR